MRLNLDLCLMQKNKIKEQILQNLPFDDFNKMQLDTFEKFKTHQNLMLLAPTGSGKTLAFLVPIIENLEKDALKTQAVIIAPNRELCLQIEAVFKSIKSGFSVCCCYGGHSFKIEQDTLSQNPDVVIATPGRLADHFERATISSKDIKTVVLDEFDKSLQMGFHEQLEVIFKALNGKQKHLLTSATKLNKLPDFLPFKEIEKLHYLKKEQNLKLELKAVHTLSAEKAETLMYLTQSFNNEVCLVFCNHREAVERISTLLSQNHIEHGLLHGGMEQIDREKNLIKFRGNAVTILVATDLAARGLDIPEIKHVVHYQLPHQEDAFTHRNGRTARMHAEGQAYFILADDENLPEYMETKLETLEVKPEITKKLSPPNVCIYISAGKKNKISKGDIMGWLIKKGGIASKAIGQITIQDFASYVCIDRNALGKSLLKLKHEKLKKQKVKIEVAS